MSTELARKLRRTPTEAERRMWRILWPLRQHGWHFRRQAAIGQYYADFACLSAKLVIEVDGDTHGVEPAMTRDEERDRYMASRGILVLRFSNADVIHNAEGVFMEIADVLGAVSRTTNTPTPSLPARGRESTRRASGLAIDIGAEAPSSPSPLRGGVRGGGSS
jgi:very-short-patch-repair endonuclease